MQPSHTYTPTDSQPSPGSLRAAGTACAAGGLVLAVGGFLTQIVQASTSVSDQLWRYPWTSGASVVTSLAWAVGQALLVLGVVGLRRSGVAGLTRTASAGAGLAIAGTALILAGHLASIAVRDRTVHDTAAQLVGGAFGLGTALTAIGMLLAGRATLRAGRWHDWRRFTPLAVGAWSLALLGLQLTPALPSAVGVYALCFTALGVALAARARTAPLGAAGAQARAQAQRA